MTNFLAKMFSFKFNRCKSHLIKHISACFDPLRDELGTVPTELHTSKYVTASMLGICAGYAKQLDITSTDKIALITDAVFEEIFRRDATEVLTMTDQWRDGHDDEFIKAYNEAMQKTDGKDTLELDWLKTYLVDNFKPSTNLML